MATLASAMDVGNPSNMERLQNLHPDWRELAGQLKAHTVTDDQIRARVSGDFRLFGESWCPHTATAAQVYANLSSELRHDWHWVLVATAHPAKFNEIVEPLIGETVPVPPALAGLLRMPSHFGEIAPDLDALKSSLQDAPPR